MVTRPPETCTVDPLGKLIGEPASAILAANALLLSGARSLRWVSKESAVTMDFQPDRLNVALSRRNRVKRFTCG